MLDTDPYRPELRDAPRNYWNCGTTKIDGFQGISKGSNDTCVWSLGGQFFVLDGGDGQDPVPAGRYYVEVEIAPGHAPDNEGVCPRVKDTLTGLCHQFAESSYANNTTRDGMDRGIRPIGTREELEGSKRIRQHRGQVPGIKNQ